MIVATRLSAICVLLSFFSVSRARGTSETVFVAHSNNLIKLTVRGSNMIYYAFGSSRQFGLVRGLECDKKKDLICWVDKKVNAIRCSSTKAKKGCSDDSPSKRTTVNIVARYGKPEGVALDPCNMMLYWTDPSRSTISVAKLQRGDEGDIIAVMTKDILTAKDGLKEPFGIAVDSCAGYVFFTDVGAGAQKLARAKTDGSNMTILIKSVARNNFSSSNTHQNLKTFSSFDTVDNLKSPKALALDRESRIIYLGDSGLSEIYKMNYNGSSVTKVATVGSVYDMALQCNKQYMFYTTSLTPYPVLLRMRRPASQRLRLQFARIYYGACSYCDDCTCNSPCSINNGGCSHFCFPKDGTRICGCPTGYKLSHLDCIAESSQLLVSNTTKVVSLLMDKYGNVRNEPNSLSFASLHRMVALDHVVYGGRHYVAYTDQSAVKRRAMDGSEEITITNGLRDPRGIATDCVTGNIYYADKDGAMIAVSNIDGTGHKVCLKSPRVREPLSLAVNTRRGEFYFSDKGYSGIYSYSMDCTGYKSKIASSHTAFGLALDDSAQVLYWAELEQREVKFYNIKNRTIKKLDIFDVKSYFHKPFGLTVFGDYLFFTNWESGCIGRISKNGGLVEAFTCNKNAKLNGISHVNSQCQRPIGSCGDCPHPRMCMLSSSGGGSYKCVCPSGFLSVDSGCELRDEDFILVSARHSIMALSLQGSSSWIAKLPLPPQNNIVAVDYDYYDRKIFWTDTATKKIQSASLDGTNIEVLVSHDVNRDVCRLCHPDGLAYDWTTGRLYYTDYASGEICFINVTSYGTKTPVRVLSGLDRPRAIVVEPQYKKKIYFSEWGKTPRISSVNIPGGNEYVSSLQVLISSNVKWPNALTISKDRSRLYFGDAGYDYMGSYNLLSRKVDVLGKTPHIFGIEQHTERHNQQYIYWSDWMKGVLKQPVHEDGSPRTQHLASASEVYRASGIRVFSKH